MRYNERYRSDLFVSAVFHIKNERYVSRLFGSFP